VTLSERHTDSKPEARREEEPFFCKSQYYGGKQICLRDRERERRDLLEAKMPFNIEPAKLEGISIPLHTHPCMAYRCCVGETVPYGVTKATSIRSGAFAACIRGTVGSICSMHTCATNVRYKLYLRKRERQRKMKRKMKRKREIAGAREKEKEKEQDG